MSSTGLTPARLSVLCGMHAYTVNRYLRGRVRPRHDNLRRLCAVLGVPFDDWKKYARTNESGRRVYRPEDRRTYEFVVTGVDGRKTTYEFSLTCVERCAINWSLRSSVNRGELRSVSSKITNARSTVSFAQAKEALCEDFFAMEWARGILGDSKNEHHVSRFQDELRIAMDNAGMNIEDLAQKTKMHRVVISKYIRGAARPGPQSLRKLCRALDTDEREWAKFISPKFSNVFDSAKLGIFGIAIEDRDGQRLNYCAKMNFLQKRALSQRLQTLASKEMIAGFSISPCAAKRPSSFERVVKLISSDVAAYYWADRTV